MRFVKVQGVCAAAGFAAFLVALFFLAVFLVFVAVGVLFDLLTAADLAAVGFFAWVVLWAVFALPALAGMVVPPAAGVEPAGDVDFAFAVPFFFVAATVFPVEDLCAPAFVLEPFLLLLADFEDARV